jgi:hypothetical protein
MISIAWRFEPSFGLVLAPVQAAVDRDGPALGQILAQLSPWLPQTVMSK